ncbi:MAG: hypothetical protein SGPRY_002683 [Prymnesium sp.]
MPEQTNRTRREQHHELFIGRLNQLFDPSLPAHLARLEELWRLSYPNDEYEGLKSDKWCDLGFQRSEPVPDLRGAGLPGVENLCYFVEHRRAEFVRSFASGSLNCFAVSGLAVTLLLRGYLGLHDPGQRLMPVAPGVQMRAATAVRHRYLAWLALDEMAFMQLNAVFLSSLQRNWLEAREAGWNLLDFPVLLVATRNHIAQSLPNATTPLNLSHIETAARRHEPTIQLEPPPHACMIPGGVSSRHIRRPSRKLCGLCPVPDFTPKAHQIDSYRIARPITERQNTEVELKIDAPAPAVPRRSDG